MSSEGGHHHHKVRESGHESIREKERCDGATNMHSLLRNIVYTID